MKEEVEKNSENIPMATQLQTGENRKEVIDELVQAVAAQNRSKEKQEAIQRLIKIDKAIDIAVNNNEEKIIAHLKGIGTVLWFIYGLLWVILCTGAAILGCICALL
jgi:16S rRNA C1402 N4-methylase RsmH